MNGLAKQTSGGLSKKDLKYNKYGKIVSKKMSYLASNRYNFQSGGAYANAYEKKKKQFEKWKHNMKNKISEHDDDKHKEIYNEISRLIELDFLVNYMHSSEVKRFADTINFLEENPCKLVMDFNKSTINNQLMNYFFQLDDDEKSYFKFILFSYPDRIGHYICKDKSNVYFYDKERLEIFVELLNEEYIIKKSSIHYNNETLLETLCRFSSNSYSFVYFLAHILFGSNDICGWQSETRNSIMSIKSIQDSHSELYNAYIKYIQIFSSDRGTDVGRKKSNASLARELKRKNMQSSRNHQFALRAARAYEYNEGALAAARAYEYNEGALAAAAAPAAAAHNTSQNARLARELAKQERNNAKLARQLGEEERRLHGINKYKINKKIKKKSSKKIKKSSKKVKKVEKVKK